ncbi:MAG: hypothetical protein ABL951_10145 [Alphaproteobacteria bacterium]
MYSPSLQMYRWRHLHADPLAICVVRAAAVTHAGMATFEQAGVSGADNR